MNSPIRDTGTHDFSVRIHSEVAVSMQVQVKGEIKEFPAEQEPEGSQTEQNDSEKQNESFQGDQNNACLLYTSPSPRDRSLSRMPSSA